MTRRHTRFLAAGALAAALLATPERAAANFHLWEIAEVYSNADGSIQYIEFTTTFDGQGVVDAHVLRATSDGVIRNFDFDRNLVGATANRSFLVATPGFAALPGAVAPDFVLPCGPFFDPAAASITIDFIGADSLTFAGSALPTDGSNALRATVSGALSTAGNAPTNFASETGLLALTACLIAGTCEPCDDGLFCNGAESCSNSACVAIAPCGLLCDEQANVCTECSSPEHCDDAEVCTAETCESGVCVHTPVAGNCDDGQFCTAFDMCAGGTCAGGSMSPCAGLNCNEDGDFCGDCASARDCEDGNPCTINECMSGLCSSIDADDSFPCHDDDVFCNGPGVCGEGSCHSAGNPCDPATTTCNESEAMCVPEPGAPAALAALVALAGIARARRRSRSARSAR